MVYCVDIIFVPQGAEYQAVCQGLNNCTSPPQIIPIPIGVKNVSNFLINKEFTDQRVLLMGLAGSLTPEHSVGDVVIFESCLYIANKLQLNEKELNCERVKCDHEATPCDRYLTKLLQEKLNLKSVKALTSDYLVHSAQDKQKLARQYQAEVVDMEGIAILDHFKSVAIIRVISDNFNDNLPNLNPVINEDGKLENKQMLIAFLKQPLAAIKLIKSSLKALKVLEETASKIF